MSVKVETEFHEPAHALSARVISSLLAPGGWGKDPVGLRGTGEVDLYSINVPMVPTLLEPGGVRISTTRIWRNSYARLFAAQPAESPTRDAHHLPRAGPDAPQARQAGPTHGQKDTDPEEVGGLVFKWAPEMSSLIKPDLGKIPVDSDAYAIHNGFVSVTPIRASFAEPPWDGVEGEQNIWAGQP